MKRNLLSLLVAFAAVLPMKALDYESARQQAWFLTDKMAYELNLTNEQYDRAYQINLDYFLSVNNPSDAFGYSWSWRNEDLRYVLFDWQYRLYSTVDYFLRPIRWSGFRWYYPVFDRYRYGYYYFGRPAIYLSYRGCTSATVPACATRIVLPRKAGVKAATSATTDAPQTVPVADITGPDTMAAATPVDTTAADTMAAATTVPVATVET